NLAFLRVVLEEAARSGDRDAVTRQIGDYYAACMDEARIEKAGIAPLAGELEAIAALKSATEIPALLARLQREMSGRLLLFEATSQQDPADAETQIASFDQGGLGLPDRDYYFRDDARSRDSRVRYEAHIARLLELLSDASDAAKASARQIVRLETALAAASLTKVERRDPYKMTHRMKPDELESLAPNLRWRDYLAAL